MHNDPFRAARFAAWATVIALLAASGPAWAGEEPISGADALPAPVNAILLDGNEKTRDSILRRELSFTEGESLTSDKLHWSRQAILDLNLFESVRASVAPAGDGAPAGSVDVTFSVEEKRFWLVLPRIGRGSDGDVSYGAKARFDNLWGLNHSFETIVRRKDFKDPLRGDEDKLVTHYHAPGWRNTRYDVDIVGLTKTLNIEEDLPGGGTSLFEEETHAISLGVGRWLGEDRIAHGWRLGGDLNHRRRNSTPITGPLNRDPSVDHFSLGFNIRYQDFHHHIWSDTGKTYGYRVEQGLDSLGDDGFTTQEAFFTGIWQLGSEHSNIYLDVGAGQSRGGDTAFVVFPRGLPDLRGILSSVEEGDSYKYLRTGYVHPIFGKDSLRGEVFLDAGRFYFEDLPRPATANVGMGFGIRWRIRSFVRLDLALGLTYLPETGETKFWATTDRIGG